MKKTADRIVKTAVTGKRGGNGVSAPLAQLFPDLAFEPVAPGSAGQRYISPEFVSKGHFGVVVRAVDARSMPTTMPGIEPPHRAVKLLQVQHANKAEPVKAFMEEIAMLSQVRHENVVRVVDWGYATCTAPDTGKPVKLPYYAMDWLEATDLQKILSDKSILINEMFLEQLALQLLAAVNACQQHPQRLVHMDIKPDNILLLNVRPSPDLDLRRQSGLTFVLTGFGMAKFMFLAEGEEVEPFQTPGGGAFPYVHPRLKPFLRSNKVPTEILRDYWRDVDVFSLGVVFMDVLNAIRERNPTRTHFARGVWDYLCADMQASGVEGAKPLAETAGAASVLRNLRAVLFTPPPVRSETKDGLMRLLGQLTVQFPPEIATLVDSPEFQRLRDVPQLSFTSFVYPSATHNRFCHAMGAYHFTHEYIRQLKSNPIFAYLFDEEDLTALKMAGLLHDLGQYPFAHTFEEIGGLGRWLDVDHFRLTGRILKGELFHRQFLESPLNNVRAAWRGRLEPSIAERINDAARDRIFAIFTGKGKYSLLKSIVAGPLDCDKLDYLIRDSTSAGVPYGDSLDVGRFFSSLTVNFENSNHLTLGITGKGRPAVESIMSARYHMFSEVYWHKTVRAAAAMLKEALWTARGNIPQTEFDLAVIGFDTRAFLLWLADKMCNEQAALDLVISLGILHTRDLYKRVRTFSEAYAEDDKRAIHHRFANDLGNDYARTTIYRDELVALLNAEGSRKSEAWKLLSTHHVLVDVPSSQRDQFEGVSVVFPNRRRAEDKQFYSFKEVSHLCRAIYESYARHTKKVRIYCHPEYRQQVLALDATLDQCIENAWNAVR